ncbi:MAG: ribosomal-processing cysteine protease Prp [Clostridium sp.]|uniref:ribosomal-processing cysteine protease Prp n=1 Tax=Clostridium sp. TaxID=1506 RepID=UPI0025BFCC73|nr:ribosomal-processing cysteine protease Prp [Clostridium sp.]MCF0147528.1 ribosomal-processing cysteine protease Prp [Clostridium sp.]
MIKVKIYEKENLRLGFKIEGHALSKAEIEKSGDAYDLICNSVSVLSQSVIIGIEEVLKLKVKYSINDGFLHINLSNLENQEIEKTQVLLLTFEKSIESLMESIKLQFGNNKYSEYIRLFKEEV